MITCLTIVWYEARIVPDVEVGQRAVNMGAYFLSCLRGSEYPDYGNPGRSFLLGIPIASGKLRIEFCGCRLVVIDAIEPDAKAVHRRLVGVELKEQKKSERMMNIISKETTPKRSKKCRRL